MDPEDFQPIEYDTPLPTVGQALAMWDQFGMLENIRAHSQLVREVALRLCAWLGQSGLHLNCRAVEVGAMLHDIAKTMCLGSDRRHDVEGARIVREAGFPALSWLVRFHVRMPQDHPLDEAMVVNYADKRVRHDEVVNIDQRFEYIAERYGRGVPEYLQRIEKGRLIAHRTERTIFTRVEPDGHTPGEITRLWKEGLL